MNRILIEEWAIEGNGRAIITNNAGSEYWMNMDNGYFFCLWSEPGMVDFGTLPTTLQNRKKFIAHWTKRHVCRFK